MMIEKIDNTAPIPANTLKRTKPNLDKIVEHLEKKVAKLRKRIKRRSKKMELREGFPDTTNAGKINSVWKAFTL